MDNDRVFGVTLQLASSVSARVIEAPSIFDALAIVRATLDDDEEILAITQISDSPVMRVI